MTKQSIFKIYYVIIPLLIVGLSFGFTTFLLALASLLPLMFVTTRHSLAIFFVMYGGVLGGVLRSLYPALPLYGIIMEFVGFILMSDLIREMFWKHLKALGGTLLILIVFGMFFLMGPRDSFSYTKYITMCTHGIFMLIGYFAFERSQKIDVEGLTNLLLISSISLFAYCIQSISMIRGGLFDYNWFRAQCESFEYMNRGDASMLVGYQHVGMMVLFAFTIFLSQTKLTFRKTVFYTICCLQLALATGARQAIIGAMLVVVLRFVYFQASKINKKNLFGRSAWIFIGSLVASIVALLFLQTVSSDVVSTTLEEGDSGRMLHFLEAITIFQDNQILGCGIGGYHAISGLMWPHNLIFELLCETGIVGTILLLFLAAIPMMNKHMRFSHVTQSNQYYFLILAAIFLRVMVSADLREGIELFSAMYALTAVKKVYSRAHFKKWRFYISSDIRCCHRLTFRVKHS